MDRSKQERPHGYLRESQGADRRACQRPLAPNELGREDVPDEAEDDERDEEDEEVHGAPDEMAPVLVRRAPRQQEADEIGDDDGGRCDDRRLDQVTRRHAQAIPGRVLGDSSSPGRRGCVARLSRSRQRR